MNKEISFNINYDNEIFHQLLNKVKETDYHWFKCKLEDGSELDLVEKKDFEKLQQENKQLKDNWDKLREWIVYHKHNENTEEHYLVVDYGTLLGKMQEIEKGDSNE